MQIKEIFLYIAGTKCLKDVTHLESSNMIYTNFLMMNYKHRLQPNILSVTKTCLEAVHVLHAFQVYSVECIYDKDISTIFNAIYGAVCFRNTHSYFDDCENICTLSFKRH